MPSDPELESLVQLLDAFVAPYEFKRTDPVPTVADVAAVGIWKRKGWLTNQGIGIVSIGGYSNLPGQFARACKSRVGRAIGYIPFVYALGLHLIVTGRGIMQATSTLEDVVDTTNSLTVLLQGVHVIDLAAGEYLANLPPLADPHVEDLKPLTQMNIEAVRTIQGLGRPVAFDPMKMSMYYSHRTGRAVRSARTWGPMNTSPAFYAIESAITLFIEGQGVGSLPGRDARSEPV